MPFSSGVYTAPSNSWNPAVPGTTISSSDFNSQLSDYETAWSTCILKDGTQTLTANIPFSGFKATGVNTNSGNTSRSEFVSGATLQDGAPLDAGLTTGSSTVYAATLTPAISAYADKQCFRVQIDETCGATPTINFNTVGAKKMYFNVAGSAVQVTTGDILANQILILRYDTALDAAAGGFWVVNQPYPLNVTGLTETTTVDNFADFVPLYDASASANRKVRPEYILGLMRGHIYGLTLSNNGSDPNNDVDIAVGDAVDNTNFALLVLASALTKRLDANWAVGTNQGGLDTGSKASSTLYYIWLIQRSDTGVVDALFSTSRTSPTMPANYDRSALIGAVSTNGSSNIIADQFTQALTGGRFKFTSAQQTVTSAGALSIPHGLGTNDYEVTATLVCIGNASNYLVGDRVQINDHINTAGGNTNQGISVIKGSSVLIGRYGLAASVFVLIDASTGNTTSQTNTNWAMILTART